MSSLLVRALTSTREAIAAKKRKEGVSSKFWHCRVEQLTSLNVERKRRVQSLGQHILDGRTDLDLEDFNPEGEVLEGQPKHLWEGVVLHLGFVPKLSEEMKRESFLDSTSSSSPLSSVTLGDPGLDELGNLTLLVEPEGMRSQLRSREGTKKDGNVPHLSMLSAVDYADDVGDGDSRLGDVGRDDDLADSRRRVVEDGGLTLGRDTGRKQGRVSFFCEGVIHSRKKGKRLTSSAAGKSQSFQRFQRRRGLAGGR